MSRSKKHDGSPNSMRGYRDDEEMYVYDQCCQNCRYYCDWDPVESLNGCKNYSREDYKQHEETGWCMDWKGKRGCR